MNVILIIFSWVLMVVKLFETLPIVVIGYCNKQIKKYKDGSN